MSADTVENEAFCYKTTLTQLKATLETLTSSQQWYKLFHSIINKQKKGKRACVWLYPSSHNTNQQQQRPQQSSSGASSFPLLGNSNAILTAPPPPCASWFITLRQKKTICAAGISSCMNWGQYEPEARKLLCSVSKAFCTLGLTHTWKAHLKRSCRHDHGHTESM